MLPQCFLDIQNKLSRVFKKYFCLEEQKLLLYLLLMKVYPGVLFLFVIYLTFWVDQNNSDYSNEAGYCRSYSSNSRCYITNNDTQLIKTLLSTGSQGSTSKNRLYVYKRYSSDSGYLTLDIEISSNIRRLYLYLSYSYNHDQIILKTSTIYTIKTRLKYTSTLRLLGRFTTCIAQTTTASRLFFALNGTSCLRNEKNLEIFDFKTFFKFCTITMT